MRYLRERHPYIEAQRKFCNGQITKAQAIGMICIDREFIAECELTGQDKRDAAEHVLRTAWVPRLVRNIQDAKRARL